MRVEMLGTSFIPQHSDARVLYQLIYKWAHSRRTIARVLVEKYEDLIEAGWSLTRGEIMRDVPRLLRDNFLEVSQSGAAPIEYPYAFIAPSNTGVPSGKDLDNSGSIGGGNDAFGFGAFPGQFGMVVFSRYPIVADQVRTFQNLLWASVPGARLPDDPATAEPADWYSADELAVLRLSSKSHWDVPIDIDGRIVHLLASHPTPPVFDGPEDRNGLRNADEIGFWADYVAGVDSSWIVDDAGTSGGSPPRPSS